jgi:hypothetical protein
MTTESYELYAAPNDFLTEAELAEAEAATEEVESSEAELAEMEAEHRHYLMTRGLEM